MSSLAGVASSTRARGPGHAARGGRLCAMLVFFAVSAACSPPGEGPATTSDAAETATGSGETAAVAEVPDVLMPPPDVAGIELRNQADEPVVFEDLRGKPTLLTFIYTRCPMPDMCPATTLRFQEVQNALSAEERERVRLVAVSFDPSYDTPEVLAEYASLWDVDAALWSLLTGAEEDIQTIASGYGVWYEPSEDGNYRHAMYSMILFPDGALHRVLLGSAWDSKEVARTLVTMATEGEAARR